MTLQIDISRLDINIHRWFRECTPKILVVTDYLNFLPSDGFGLTEFVDSVRAATIHGMTPIVVTAQFNPDPAAALIYDATNRHITNYKFTDPTHGLLKSRFDIVFILSIGRETAPLLTDEVGALDAVTAFMQAGGGVFATGDHEDLGAAMCMDIPRVRNMRYWRLADTPTAGGSDRLTTNLPGRGDIPGSNDTYEFADQSDRFPQRLYVNYRTLAGGYSGMGLAAGDHPHPVLQVPGGGRAIEVFPDHPHEGECVVPSNLTTKLADQATDEWPVQTGSNDRVTPEMVALTVSHGGGFPGKQPVVPRSFIAICAYDGQRANVGRVLTDATWHHFVNINIKPGLAAIAGRDLADIKQYYANLASWLMPRNVRYCRRFPWIIQELTRYPLFEELSFIPRRSLDGPGLRDVGALVEGALLARHTRAEVSQVMEDALEEAIGPDARSRLDELARDIGTVSYREAGQAALGALTLATAERLIELKDKDELDGEEVFMEVGRAATREGVKLYLVHARGKLGKLEGLIDSIANARALEIA